ncbi:retrotransposon hot spot (RHS) protein [Trypanosoma cruzi]|nr:retrotransposon hot spot (RHS) protein [Trypanosoma cruzi]
MLAKLMPQADFNLFVSRVRDYLISENFGKCAMFAFLNGAFVGAIRRKLKELRPPARRPSHRCAPEVYSQEGPASHYFFPSVEHIDKKTCIKYWLLYIPEVEDFPLVDGFFFVDSPRKTLVGLRMATAGEHNTTAGTVRQFTGCLAAYFDGWEELSREMSWEIICVQHADRVLMGGWQRCDAVEHPSEGECGEEAVAVFAEFGLRKGCRCQVGGWRMQKYVFSTVSETGACFSPRIPVVLCLNEHCGVSGRWKGSHLGLCWWWWHRHVFVAWPHG